MRREGNSRLTFVRQVQRSYTVVQIKRTDSFRKKAFKREGTKECLLSSKLLLCIKRYKTLLQCVWLLFLIINSENKKTWLLTPRIPSRHKELDYHTPLV